MPSGVIDVSNKLYRHHRRSDNVVLARNTDDDAVPRAVEDVDGVLGAERERSKAKHAPLLDSRSQIYRALGTAATTHNTSNASPTRACNV